MENLHDWMPCFYWLPGALLPSLYPCMHSPLDGGDPLAIHSPHLLTLIMICGTWFKQADVLQHQVLHLI